MPEVGFSEADKLSKSKDEEFPSDDQLLSQIHSDPDLTFIRKGAESIIVATESKPDKVMAISYGDLTPQEAKRQFYMQRVFSTLFPNNFPHFYAAFGSSDAEKPRDLKTLVSRNSTFTTGTVREQIHKQERRKLGIKEKIWRKITKNPEVKFPFDLAWKGFKQMSIDPNLILDTDWGGLDINLQLGKDGGEYYMDKIHVPEWFSYTYKDSILGYMDKNKYTDVQRQMVRTSLERLSVLSARS